MKMVFVHIDAVGKRRDTTSRQFCTSTRDI
jgi:hypothetical protein